MTVMVTERKDVIGVTVQVVKIAHIVIQEKSNVTYVKAKAKLYVTTAIAKDKLHVQIAMVKEQINNCGTHNTGFALSGGRFE
jgi:hypothetical protein